MGSARSATGQAYAMRYVVRFSEGGREAASLLGGKGANLCELVKLGVPVPPGFVISTRASAEYLEAGELPQSLLAEAMSALGEIGDELGRGFGDPERPLLVSVRSGAPVSMPGMMDTVLNVGMSDATTDGLARLFGDRDLAVDCYRRLIHSFATTVRGLSEDQLGSTSDLAGMRSAVAAASGRDFPTDPRDQLAEAVIAVLESWNSKRAQRYRKFHGLPDTGTAIVVQAMVFGNAGDDSGTGVLFTRDPSSGEPEIFGDYLPNAQGEDIVAGTHNAQDLSTLAGVLPEAHAQLTSTARAIELHYRDMCEIEFTIERGRLWILQTRVGQRSVRAAVRVAADLAEDGVIEPADALARVNPDLLDAELRPQLDADALDEAAVLATGIGASPGLVSGRVVFDSQRATERREAGDTVILARPETRPEDLDGILAADGLLTSRGGKTSHAAVVARGLGRCCVCGAESVEMDPDARLMRVDGRVVEEGDVVSLDGDGGRVILGEAPVREAKTPIGLEQLLAWADARRDLAVDALVASAPDVAAAIALGADGLILQVNPHGGALSPAVRDELEREIPLPFAIRAAELDPADDRHRRWLDELLESLAAAPATPSHLILPAAYAAIATAAVADAGISVRIAAEPDEPDALAGTGDAAWALPALVDAEAVHRARSAGATRLGVGVNRLRAARLIAAQTALV